MTQIIITIIARIEVNNYRNAINNNRMLLTIRIMAIVVNISVIMVNKHCTKHKTKQAWNKSCK